MTAEKESAGPPSPLRDADDELREFASEIADEAAIANAVASGAVTAEQGAYSLALLRVHRAARAASTGQEPPRAEENLAQVLDDVATFYMRFVRFRSEAQVTAQSLWTAHTHALDAADSTANLHVSSPEKRSGKTRDLDVAELLVARPWRAVTPTEAVVFRKIAADCPTFLLDEVDALWGKEAGQYEGLRALLNAGHRRGVTVPRCVGEGKTLKVVDFPVFCPKAIAGIGSLPDTIADRSIPIRLDRRAPGESVERFRIREVGPEGEALHGRLVAWAEDAIERLRAARPSIPNELNDRAADGWEPLLAIADAAGGDWPARARRAALELHCAGEEDPSLPVLLLEAMREAFGDRDRMTTADLLAALIDHESGPWAGWWGDAVEAGRTRGPASKMARILKSFVAPRKIRTPTGTAQGYLRDDLEDPWNRYLNPLFPYFPPIERNNGTPQVESHIRGSERVDPKSPKTASEQGSSVVPSFSEEQGEQGVAAGTADEIARAVELFKTELDAEEIP